jgi:hypothetical protein
MLHVLLAAADYGVNDGGRFVDHKELRKANFLDFLNLKDDDSAITAITNREGLYYTKDFTSSGGGLTVKVIFLDTRTHRDNNYIRSVGELHLPFTALVSASTRLCLASLGVGSAHAGDVLGREQWLWLEDTLATSTADVHVLVSSIQIATSNPAVESWGHFPLSKKRLMNIFKTYDPSGLVLLSGDVHHAEVSSIEYSRADGSEGRWYEITASGLTHTCRDSRLTRYLCPLMLDTFNAHRAEEDSYFMERNFGLLTISACDQAGAGAGVGVGVGTGTGAGTGAGTGLSESATPCRAVVNASVLSLESGRRLEQLIALPARAAPAPGIGVGVGVGAGGSPLSFSSSSSPIETVHLSHFPKFSISSDSEQDVWVGVTIFSFLLLLLFVGVFKCIRKIFSRSSFYSKKVKEN